MTASTAAVPVRFGVFFSQANRTWAQTIEEFQRAEELGFDHAWLPDHLMPTDGPTDGPMLEAWTLVAAIAARTSRIRLGVLVSSNTFRHPAVLAKQAVTVDHISGGRLTLGIGAGWHEEEHRRYGIPLPAVGERVDRLEEAVQVLRMLMSQERSTYEGRHYRLDDAPFSPLPVQQPRIPLLIAAHRPRMLRIAARYADQWDTFANLAGTATDGVTTDLGERIRALDEACREVGRDPSEIRRSTWTTGDAVASEAAYEDFVRTHHALGFTDFMTERPHPADLPVMERIARERIPALRAEFSAT